MEYRSKTVLEPCGIGYGGQYPAHGATPQLAEKSGVRQDARIGVQADLLGATKELLHLAPQYGTMFFIACGDVAQGCKYRRCSLGAMGITGANGINQGNEKSQGTLRCVSVRAFENGNHIGFQHQQIVTDGAGRLCAMRLIALMCRRLANADFFA